jgi:hypothetical protein
MDFRRLLLSFPSGFEKELYIAEVGASEKKFKDLLDISLFEKDPLAWRAAWIVDGTDEQFPGLARDFIFSIVQSLPEIESKGCLRSLLRMLCRYEIAEEKQGMLIDLCFKYLVSELYPVAVKVHAMQIIYNHALIYPELKEELITVISDQVDNNSVGFKARGKRLIKKMEGLN